RQALSIFTLPKAQRLGADYCRMWSGVYGRLNPLCHAQIGQKDGEHTQQRQEGTDLIDEFDALEVCQITEYRRPDTPHAEGQAIEQPGDHADARRYQFLSVNDNGRESGGDHAADDHAEYAGPEQIDMGHGQRERCDPQNGYPDDPFAADTI